MSEKYWFRRKIYGWGWYPSSWEGWAVIIVWVAFFYLALQWGMSNQGNYKFDISIIIEIVLIIVLIAISWVKGESPKWSWGR